MSVTLETPAAIEIEKLPAEVRSKLLATQDAYIRRWGEMGQTWGINRTMAEIHALLFVTAMPLCTDDVMARLHISRGNASMSLRALCDWGIIRRLHKRGERREYFESLSDVWEIFSIIATERKRREMDPVLDTLRDCNVAMREPPLAKASTHERVRATRERLASIEEFMSLVSQVFAQFIETDKAGMSGIVTTLLRSVDGPPLPTKNKNG